MKIGIFTDLRFTCLDTPTGVTKHIVQMAKGLFEQNNIEIIVLAAKDQLDQQGKIPPQNALSYLPVRILPFSWHQIYWSSFAVDFPLFDKYTSDLDFVYCPKNDYLPLRKTRFAVTFHGAHELDAEYPNSKSFRHSVYAWRSRRRYLQMVNQADLILTVSDFLAHKIIDWFGAERQKIKVVGNGVESIFYEQAKFTQYNRDSYFLAVGGLNFLDGGDRIVDLANYLQQNNDSREIWVAGNQHESKILKSAEGLKNIKLLGYLKKDKLAEIMSRAAALVFLTRYETFGIAAAEAMVVGVPIITHRNTAVPEIVSNAGHYIDVSQASAIDEIVRVSHDLNQKIEIGKQISRSYTWETCSANLIAALQSF